MQPDKIIELARRYSEPTKQCHAEFDHPVICWEFSQEELLAFTRSVIKEEREKYQELIAAAEAIVMTQDIYGGIPTKIVDHLRDVIVRINE